MRARTRPVAVALLAAAALALAACSGGPPPQTSAPTAAATPEAAPAPDATPAPEQACANGVAVADPEANPGLVSDCEALLSSKDALRGSASLDWSGGKAIANWEGVAVEGSPPRVTGLDLSGKGLTGTIPPELGALTRLSILDLHANRLTGGIPAQLGDAAGLAVLDLDGNRLGGGIPRSFGRLPRLYEIRLSGNALTGCVPSALEDARGDAADLGLPWCSPPRPEVRSALDVLLAQRGLDLILPAPGAFAHRTFEDGEAIDWTRGIFVLDVETGLTEGYAVAGLESAEHYYRGHRGGWIATDDDGEWDLLLDRETGQSWRWPRRSTLWLLGTSEALLLFGELGPNPVTDRYILANRRMEEVARFSVDGDVQSAMFSPDGRVIALATADKAYLVPVATGRPAVLFSPPQRHPENENLRLRHVHVDSRQRPPFGRAWIIYEGGAGIVATASYGGNKDDTVLREQRYYNWDGEESPAPACPGTLSPDGRYAAAQEGGPYFIKYVGVQPLENPWPSVVVTDAETCAPIFRVRIGAYVRT